MFNDIQDYLGKALKILRNHPEVKEVYTTGETHGYFTDKICLVLAYNCETDIASFHNEIIKEICCTEIEIVSMSISDISSKQSELNLVYSQEIDKLMCPTNNIRENKDKYVPLYCYTATSSYALSLSFNERQNTVVSLRKLFEYYCKLLMEKDSKYYLEWKEYALENKVPYVSIALHYQSVANFTEGNTFVSIGSPDGYYFDPGTKGLEFGELTYVMRDMYDYLKEYYDYYSLIDNAHIKDSELYETIINNTNNRRVFLKARLLKSDITYFGNILRDECRANAETFDDRMNDIMSYFLCCTNNRSSQAAILRPDFKFAEPLGNCKYSLSNGISEITDIEKERSMAYIYLLPEAEDINTRLKAKLYGKS